MKNILFATTALVATAGIASADVSISGFAEMGIYDNGNGDMQFFNDIDVTFSMSGETDGGLSFGAAVDLDEISDTVVNAATDNNSRAGIAAFVSGGFGKVTLGDTDDALDWALTETAIGGAMADDHTEHDGYNGNGYGAKDGQVLRYEYSFSNVSVAISSEQGDDGVGVVDDTTSVGVKTDLDLAGTTVSLGAGFIDAGADDGFGISAKAGFGAVTAVLNVSEFADVDHIGLGLGYTMDALTVGFNWGEYDDAGTTTDGYGLAVNYDLGGGAVVQFGYGDDDTNDTFSLGLALSF